LRGLGATAPAGYERIAPQLKDIKGFDDAATWAGETFGQGAASTAAPIALGVAGGSVGGIPGAIIGGCSWGSFQIMVKLIKLLRMRGLSRRERRR